ncbi:hypothetical protein SUDANB6_05579 [Streptomyces sp. enrichment culture]
MTGVSLEIHLRGVLSSAPWQIRPAAACGGREGGHVVVRTRSTSTAAPVLAATAASAAPAAAGAAPVGDQDVRFVKAAHQGDLAEIAAGRDARKHATTACVKRAGAVLVRDHGKLDPDLAALAAKLGIALPASPAAEQKQKLAAAQARAGSPAYDTAWLEVREAARTETLALIDHELRAGGNAGAKAAARAARPVVAKHLDMVRGGTCHTATDAGTVKAGSGGQFAAGGPAPSAAAFGLAGGALLVGPVAGRLVRGRRSAAPGTSTRGATARARSPPCTPCGRAHRSRWWAPTATPTVTWSPPAAPARSGRSPATCSAVRASTGSRS